MKSSYGEQLKASHQFTEDEIDVVVNSTVTLLRRHSIRATICPCGNDDPNAFSVSRVDELGFITQVKCSCGDQLSTICRLSACHYELVDDLSTLVPGDHITWHRPYFIWHHAVVSRQDRATQEFTVLDYMLSEGGPFVEIVERTIAYDGCVSLLAGSLYRAVYDDSYTNEYTVLRVEKSRGQRKYDAFEQNCEHSTHWCKTGIHDSVQMEICFTTSGKVVLLICLRLLTLVILWLLQLSFYSDPRDERQQRQVVVLNAVYMAFIAMIFFVHSLYHSGKTIQPIKHEKPHDTDICGIEACRRKFADVTHKCCCCGRKHMVPNAVLLVLGCTSCFLCSFLDACCSVARKNIQCGSGTLCRRPASVIVGLFIRIFVRESIAAVGPLLIVIFEEKIVNHFGVYDSGAPGVLRAVVIIVSLIVASIVAYIVGAFIGVWIEAAFRCCTRWRCRCQPCTVCDQRHQQEQPTSQQGEENQAAREEFELTIEPDC